MSNERERKKQHDISHKALLDQFAVLHYKIGGLNEVIAEYKYWKEEPSNLPRLESVASKYVVSALNDQLASLSNIIVNGRGLTQVEIEYFINKRDELKRATREVKDIVQNLRAFKYKKPQPSSQQSIANIFLPIPKPEVRDSLFESIRPIIEEELNPLNVERIDLFSEQGNLNLNNNINFVNQEIDNFPNLIAPKPKKMQIEGPRINFNVPLLSGEQQDANAREQLTEDQMNFFSNLMPEQKVRKPKAVQYNTLQAMQSFYANDQKKKYDEKFAKAGPYIGANKSNNASISNSSEFIKQFGVSPYSKYMGSRFQVAPTYTDKDVAGNKKKQADHTQLKMLIASNPQLNVIPNWFASLAAFKGIDTNYVFDGRYWYIDGLDIPINRKQIKDLTKALNIYKLKIPPVTPENVRLLEIIKFHMKQARALLGMNLASQNLISGLRTLVKIDNMQNNWSKSGNGYMRSATKEFIKLANRLTDLTEKTIKSSSYNNRSIYLPLLGETQGLNYADLQAYARAGSIWSRAEKEARNTKLIDNFGIGLAAYNKQNSTKQKHLGSIRTHSTVEGVTKEPSWLEVDVGKSGPGKGIQTKFDGGNYFQHSSLGTYDELVPLYGKRGDNVTRLYEGIDPSRVTTAVGEFIAKNKSNFKVNQFSSTNKLITILPLTIVQNNLLSSLNTVFLIKGEGKFPDKIGDPFNPILCLNRKVG